MVKYSVLRHNQGEKSGEERRIETRKLPNQPYPLYMNDRARSLNQRYPLVSSMDRAASHPKASRGVDFVKLFDGEARVPIKSLNFAGRGIILPPLPLSKCSNRQLSRGVHSSYPRVMKRIKRVPKPLADLEAFRFLFFYFASSVQGNCIFLILHPLKFCLGRWGWD